MKRHLLKGMLAILLACGAMTAHAEDYRDMKPLKLTTPEMKPELTYEGVRERRPELELRYDDHAPWAKENWTWMRTNPGVTAYKPMDDLTFAGVPIFIAGLIAKSEKTAFAQQRKHSLLTEFKTGIDDYSQYFGPAMTVGLKVAGVEGRSDWGRFLASTAMSYGIMAALVNGIKYTAKEMRPDGSQANSWPSGHTATAFVGASILHKEYGLTRSPWYSVAGYGVATATGVMRVLNNRHWVSDVLSGAGIGIMSTEVAYALSDLIFKGRGLLRNDIPGMANVIEHPSFFSISMGIGLGSRDLDFDLKQFGWSDDMNLKFQASTAVGAEGAYFFNPYFGLGGRLRVKSSPIKGWNKITDLAWEDVNYIVNNLDEEDMQYIETEVDDIDFVINSDHLTEFAVDLGAYFNFPLSDRFALGTKLLVGRSIMQELDLNGIINGKQYNEGDEAGKPTGKDFNVEWDYFTVSANNTMKCGTGISLTYAYKQNFSWKLFLDYDYARKTYTMIYDLGGYVKALVPSALDGVTPQEYKEYLVYEKSIKKNMHSFVLGGSFAINF